MRFWSTLKTQTWQPMSFGIVKEMFSEVNTNKASFKVDFEWYCEGTDWRRVRRPRDCIFLWHGGSMVSCHGALWNSTAAEERGWQQWSHAEANMTCPVLSLQASSIGTWSPRTSSAWDQSWWKSQTLGWPEKSDQGLPTQTTCLPDGGYDFSQNYFTAHLCKVPSQKSGASHQH